MGKGFKKVFDFLGKCIALVLVVVWVVLLINAQWTFITNETVLQILTVIKEFGALVLVGVVGLEAVSDKPFIVRIIFYALCAVIVLFLFFPATYENLITAINNKI